MVLKNGRLRLLRVIICSRTLHVFFRPYVGRRTRSIGVRRQLRQLTASASRWTDAVENSVPASQESPIGKSLSTITQGKIFWFWKTCRYRRAGQNFERLFPNINEQARSFLCINILFYMIKQQLDDQGNQLLAGVCIKKVVYGKSWQCVTVFCFPLPHHAKTLVW